METVAEYSLVIIKVALRNRALGSVGNLSKDLFERRTLTGSEAFSLRICLDSNKFAKFLFSYNDDLPESFNQTTAQ